MSEPTTPIYFTWESFMPDHRQYKQNSTILKPAQRIIIVVSLPIKSEYIANADKILIGQLNADAVEAFLTPLGMRYCMDQLESVLPDVPLQAKDIDPDVEDDDGWDKGETKTTDIDEELGW